MVRPDKVYLIVREVLCRAQFRTRGSKLILYEGSFKKGLRRWGHTIGLEPRAHLGLGILVPYISPPLIHTQLLERIKEPAEPFGLKSPMARDSCGYGFSLMLLKRSVVPRRQVQLSLMPDGSRTEVVRVSIIFGICKVVHESRPFIA